MKQVRVHRARLVEDETVEKLWIFVEDEMPSFETLSQEAHFYELEAYGLATALRNSLPRGTFDQLIKPMPLMAANWCPSEGV